MWLCSAYAPVLDPNTGEAYGRERLTESLIGAKDARDAVGKAEAALREFTGEKEQTDDITMLCVALK